MGLKDNWVDLAFGLILQSSSGWPFKHLWRDSSYMHFYLSLGKKHSSKMKTAKPILTSILKLTRTFFSYQLPVHKLLYLN